MQVWKMIPYVNPMWILVLILSARIAGEPEALSEVVELRRT
jgi:hypothetical protein